jgi:flavin reductase (DIM6/NTAB) family NADH-FMN oxidoreductase RutF
MAEGVGAEALRSVMRSWASGVTLVTARLGERRHGMTVSSFTSVSLDPPLVVVSLEKTSNTHALVISSGAFAVTILDESQADLAARFAGGVPDKQDRFDQLPTEVAVTGSAIPAGGLAALDCRVVSSYPVGTHTLIVGQVVHAQVRRDGRPLLYFHRDYRTLTPG